MAFGFATSSRSDFVHHMHIMAPRLRCRKGKSGLEDRQIVPFYVAFQIFGSYLL